MIATGPTKRIPRKKNCTKQWKNDFITIEALLAGGMWRGKNEHR